VVSRRAAAKREELPDGSFDVVIRGHGLAAVIAAVDCARIGLRTVVVSPSDWSETRISASARAGVMEELCAELGIEFETIYPRKGDESVLGIPASPFSRTVRQACGWAGAWRVYLDRVRPLLAIGEERNLARLVTSRLGATALDKLVRPHTEAVLGCAPEDVDIVDCVPELLPALSRVGSLTLGVVELLATDERFTSMIAPRGGIRALETAAIARADHFAVTRTAPDWQQFSGHTTLDLSAPLFTQALDRAVPIARELAREARRRILADTDYRPIGPVDLER